MHKPLLCALLLTLLSTGAAAQGETCEALRARIESQIAAKGVTQFTVSTVDTAASVPGKTVGSCDLGRKKIVYARSAGAAAAQAPQANAQPPKQQPTHPTPDSEIWVECKDGSLVKGGGCKP